jgi:NAD(P)-dependent dehydrogenase (short-subunit alcohol dehydrogenase family)
VTGAARGIGRATALRLAADGADVIACDIDSGHGIDSTDFYGLATPSDLDETARLVSLRGRRCVTAKVDIRDREQLGTAAERGVAELVGSTSSRRARGSRPSRRSRRWTTTPGIR